MLQSSLQGWPRVLRPLASRPQLLAGIVIGVVLYFVSAHWVERVVTRALIGWDSGVIVFLILAFFYMFDVSQAQIRQRAIDHDDGRRLILLLTIFAAVASVGALVAELSDAKGTPGAGYRVALAAGTVVLSWLFVQIVFAMHYAHVYYLAADEGGHKGGLEFGYDTPPDYWDFVHFSIVIGATSQTADITYSSKETRRIGTLQTLVAFGFNTAILATMINLAANFI